MIRARSFIRFAAAGVCAACSFLLIPCAVLALEENRLAPLSKEIIESGDGESAVAPLEEIKELYLTDNNYSGYVDFLRSIGDRKKALLPYINYYIALTRYEHLKYLEEKQLWDEYFAEGNAYRGHITSGAQDAIDATGTVEALNLKARLLLWQFHRGQQDALAEEGLTDLMNAATSYSGGRGDIKLLKDAADKILAGGERGKAREMYKLYVDKIVAAQVSGDEIKKIALGFYNEGNFDLAESMYDMYIERIMKVKEQKKEETAAVLIETAKMFAYRKTVPCDAAYAEKIFRMIEEAGFADVWTEDLLYLRATNLLRAKEFAKAKDVYADFAVRFPLSVRADEAVYKSALISIYALHDMAAQEPLKKLAGRQENISYYVTAGLYHLGLLAQWSDNAAEALRYYNQALEKAGDTFPETAALARGRMSEVQESKPLEYNLKSFLDAACSATPVVPEESRGLQLVCEPAQAAVGENVTVSAAASVGATGCFQVELQYLWSGRLGASAPGSVSSFTTSYAEPGVKEINLIVLSATGIVDYGIDFTDVE